MLIWLKEREEFLSSQDSHNQDSRLKTQTLKTFQGPKIRHKPIEIDKLEIKRFKQAKINNWFRMLHRDSLIDWACLKTSHSKTKIREEKVEGFQTWWETHSSTSCSISSWWSISSHEIGRLEMKNRETTIETKIIMTETNLSDLL